MTPPNTLPSFYARSGFIHPLFSPSGKILTDDFPVGHAHQHGIMTAWVNAEFRRKPIDFWNQQLQTGSAKHVSVEAIETGAVTTTIKLRLEQYSLLYGTILSDVKKKQLSPGNEPQLRHHCPALLRLAAIQLRYH